MFVAVWKGLMVAVKVMEHQLENRKTMRNAWEMAVAQSLQHPNIITVCVCVHTCVYSPWEKFQTSDDASFGSTCSST